MTALKQFNLCFHGVGRPTRELEPREAEYWISDDFFTEILDLIRDRGDVRLSFDDGNESDVSVALPELRARRLRATFYPVAERIDQPGSVTRAGLRELVAHGMYVGSHGMQHRPWRGMTDAQLDRELVEARDIIAAATGTPVFSAACPLGSYDRRVSNRLRQLDYLRVYTSDRAPARPSSWMQPRFSVRSFDDMTTVRDILSGRAGERAAMLQSARMALKRWR